MNLKKEDRENRRAKWIEEYSWQQTEGIITREKFLERIDAIRKEDEKELDNVPELPPEPPTPEEIERTYDILKYFKPYRKHYDEVLRNPQDKWADQLAEMAGLEVIIGPPLPEYEGTKFSAYVITNLPFPKQSEELREEFWKCSECNYMYGRLASDEPESYCGNCGVDASKLVLLSDNKAIPYPNEENPIAMVFSSSICGGYL